MKSSRELLSSLLKTTQMGQIGIRSVLKQQLKPELRTAMEAQLKEYDKIETEAHSLAEKHRWTVPEIHPSIRFMTDSMTRMKLSFGNVNSKTAAMMIRGNTSGIIKGYKNLNHLSETDTEICSLADKLIQTENANVDQMKPFL